MINATFNIGGLNIGWYGIMIAVGVLTAIGIALIEAGRKRPAYRQHGAGYSSRRHRRKPVSLYQEAKWSVS